MKNWEDVSWEDIAMAKICKIRNGKRVEGLQYGSVPVYGSGGIFGKTNIAIYDKPSVLLGRKGNIDTPQYVDRPFWSVDTSFWTEIDKTIVIPKFFYYMCCRIDFKKLMTGSTVPSMTQTMLNNITFKLPPLPEQKAIETCLSDIDELINGLEALITKKQQILKGTMQELLTAKTRLDGFTEEWEEKTLGEIGSTFNGLSGKTKKDFGQGQPYITYLNVFNKTKINEDTCFDYVSIGKKEKQNEVQYGDILFTTSSETLEEVGMSSVIVFHPIKRLFLNSFCFGFRLKESKNILLPEFAAYLFLSGSIRKKIVKLGKGSTRYNLSKVAFMNISIPIPSLPEQEAIASILSDMDAEIEGIRQRLQKTRQLKEGMMQDLLTGKVRLSLK